jgi:hypothetical protein
MAGCVENSHLNTQSMDWTVLRRKDSATDAQRVTLRQHSYRAGPIVSKIFPGQPLRDANKQPLREYFYHIRLLATSAWRVPVLYGRLPRTPAADEHSYERGIYGLFMMLLFRPHRQVGDLAHVVLQTQPSPRSEDEAWNAIHTECVRWRKDIDAHCLFVTPTPPGRRGLPATQTWMR